MKSIIRRKIAQFLLILGVVLGLSPIVVECASNPIVSFTNVSQDKGRIKNTCVAVNELIRDNGIFTDTGAGPVDFLICTVDNTTNNVDIEVNMLNYKKLNQKGKETVMQCALDTIYNSNISRTNRNKLYNEIADLDSSVSSLVRQLSNDVTADFANAYTSFKPFSGVLGWLLGIISIAMFALIAITMVWDIAYINLPMFQLALDNGKDNKPFGVSREAVDAVKNSEASVGSGNFVSATGTYMKTKTKQMIAIFICLLYLVSGEIYTLIAMIMDYFQGFVNLAG